MPQDASLLVRQVSEGISSAVQAVAHHAILAASSYIIAIAAAKGAQRITGKKMTLGQEEIFHEETKHIDYSEGDVFGQLVQIGVDILE